MTFDGIADGFNELRSGLISNGVHEPNYDKLGVAVAYTFKYMPQRISTVAAALTLLTRSGCQPPRRILDIGSGTDATRVALELSLANSDQSSDATTPMQLVTVEPSYIMQSFGKTIGIGPGLTSDQVRRYTSGLDYTSCSFDCPETFESERDFDCIILSACLPYNLPTSSMYWNALVAEITQRAADSCVIVIIEPRAKRDPLQRLAKSFADAGSCVVQTHLDVGAEPRYNSVGLGPIVHPQPLPFLNNSLRQLSAGIFSSPQLQAGSTMLRGMMYGIESWNPNRCECICLVFLNRPPQRKVDTTPWSRFLQTFRGHIRSR